MFVGKAPRFVLALLLSAPLALVAACDTPAAPGVDGGDDEKGDADDLDGDGIPNNSDPDIDGDDIPNAADADMDGDRIPNELDDDVDGDGVLNADDDSAFGFNPPGVSGPWADPDADGLPNVIDEDDNDDGIKDGVIGVGSCDGIAPAADENTDCDGYCLVPEGGLLPCEDGGIPGTGATDTDGDGTPDIIDGDDDNDGIPDDVDTNPRGNDLCIGFEGPPPPGCFPDEEEPEPTCTTRTFLPAEAIPPRILLVVDRSASMNSAAAGFGGSKWNATVDALVGPASGSDGGVVGQLAQSVEFGLMLYPAGDGTQPQQCFAGTVSEDVTLQNHADIRSILRGSVAVGGTPTAATLGVALGALASLPTTDVNGNELGQRAVILATDGGPNCNENLDGETCRCVASQDQCENFAPNCLDDTRTVAAAAALNLAGFPVFVLGLDGALSFADVLTRTAQAGGTSNFFPIGSSQVLAETIEDIAIQIGSCRFTLDSAPTADQVSVKVDGQVIARDTNRANGWDLTGVSTVEFFGAACDTASRATQNVSVDVCF